MSFIHVLLELGFMLHSLSFSFHRPSSEQKKPLFHQLVKAIYYTTVPRVKVKKIQKIGLQQCTEQLNLEINGTALFGRKKRASRYNHQKTC